jgi:hypothetical protein
MYSVLDCSFWIKESSRKTIRCVLPLQVLGITPRSPHLTPSKNHSFCTDKVVILVHCFGNVEPKSSACLMCWIYTVASLRILMVFVSVWPVLKGSNFGVRRLLIALLDTINILLLGTKPEYWNRNNYNNPPQNLQWATTNKFFKEVVSDATKIKRLSRSLVRYYSPVQLPYYVGGSRLITNWRLAFVHYICLLVNSSSFHRY